MNELKHVPGRVIVKVDREQKNHYTFSNGVTIRIERDYNNLDRSYTQQIFGVAIDGENIPTDALVLFHFNSLHDTYKVFNHSGLSGEEIASGIEVFSIMERDIYVWKMAGEKEWKPCKNYALALRVFEPYKGILEGIEPKVLKDTLYVTTGEFKGQVVKTLKACDAQLIFRNEKGVDETLIRFRPNGSKEDQREPEAVAILHELTDKVNKGEFFVGITTKDAKPIENIVYAD